ncbi:hypothetical protein HDU76_012471 [Blyttiomyces sp. JEL0837]|nr:hypothetical protein HDU76_012471 [Blyttiomyces sp. JEL0837]
MADQHESNGKPKSQLPNPLGVEPVAKGSFSGTASPNIGRSRSGSMLMGKPETQQPPTHSRGGSAARNSKTPEPAISGADPASNSDDGDEASIAGGMASSTNSRRSSAGSLATKKKKKGGKKRSRKGSKSNDNGGGNASGGSPIAEGFAEAKNNESDESEDSEEDIDLKEVAESMLKAEQEAASGNKEGSSMLDITKTGDKSTTASMDPLLQAQGNDESLTAGTSEAALFEDLQNALSFLTENTGEHAEDTTLTRVRGEYDKLHKLFMQSRKNEQALIKKCKDLTSELAANSAKVQAALKLSQNDRGTIAALKKEVKKAWKMVEASGEKEDRAKEAIARLKLEVDALRKQIGDDSAIVPTTAIAGFGTGGYAKMMETQLDQEEIIQKLTKEKEAVMRDQDTLKTQNNMLESEIEELNHKISNILADRSALDQEMRSLKDLLATKKSEQDRESRAREKLEVSLKVAGEASSKKDAEISIKVSEAKILKESISKLESQVKEEKDRWVKETKEKDALGSKLKSLERDYDDMIMENTKLISENQDKAADLKNWEEELSRYKEEFKSISRVKDSLQKKIKVIEEGKLEAEVERDNLRGVNNSLHHEHDTLRRQLEGCHKQIESLTRERDIAQKNFVKATGATQKQLNMMKLADQTKRNLEQEIMAYKDEASKMRKLIYSLEKDRDKSINEASKIEQDLVSREEELKIKEMMIFDSRKKIADFERKLKEQQTLYENVRADRNLYSKNLVESQDEINEMKRKLKIMSHQVEQLKEEIASKEAGLAKEHFEHSKLEKEKEGLALTIAKLQQQFEEAQQSIQNQIAEENKLRHIIAEADAERMRQKKEYEAIVQERDILGTQLIRRNDELSLLYEKIKIQTSTLNKGEIQYRERLEDIRVLKLEIKKLRREKAILQTETQNVEGLRGEIFRLQREILRERTRVKVLEEELESPMNIHRWRKLSGSDPSTYELITKIQTLQKRLIAKTEEVVEKDLVITQKEKLYKEIKDVLQRQPGPEIVEELRVVREAVRSKMRECKSLASELNMYHSQVNEYKYEIERLTGELQDLKKKYYDRRMRAKAERLLQMNGSEFNTGVVSETFGNFGDKTKEAPNYDIKNLMSEKLRTSTKLHGNPPNGPRFSGGGFNMSVGTNSTNGRQSMSAAVTRGGERYSVIPKTEGDNNRAELVA